MASSHAPDHHNNVGQCTLSDAHYHYRQPVSAEQAMTQMPGSVEVDNHGFGVKDKP